MYPCVFTVSRRILQNNNGPGAILSAVSICVLFAAFLDVLLGIARVRSWLIGAHLSGFNTSLYESCV